MKSVNLSFLRRGCRVHGVKEEADTYDGAENPQKRRGAMLMGVWSRQPSRQCPPYKWQDQTAAPLRGIQPRHSPIQFGPPDYGTAAARDLAASSSCSWQTCMQSPRWLHDYSSSALVCNSAALLAVFACAASSRPSSLDRLSRKQMRPKHSAPPPPSTPPPPDTFSGDGTRFESE